MATNIDIENTTKKAKDRGIQTPLKSKQSCSTSDTGCIISTISRKYYIRLFQLTSPLNTDSFPH